MCFSESLFSCSIWEYPGSDVWCLIFLVASLVHLWITYGSQMVQVVFLSAILGSSRAVLILNVLKGPGEPNSKKTHKESNAKWKNKLQKSMQDCHQTPATSKWRTRKSGCVSSLEQSCLPECGLFPELFHSFISRGFHYCKAYYSLYIYTTNIVLNFSYSRITPARSCIFPLNAAVSYSVLLPCGMMKALCFA